MPSRSQDMDQADGEGRENFAQLQESLHGEGHDYVVGSPHLRHTALRERVNNQIRTAVGEVLRRQPECHVLEVGAGHGSFTEIVLDAGGTAVITEMSKPSVEFLKRKFSTTPGVKVQFDSDGGEPFRLGEKFDLILLISVVHHIPDYLGTIARLCDEVLRGGGSILTFQDPLWYPRQSRWSLLSSTGMYLAWRITQGEFKRGLKTRMRRLTGKLNESEPSDMVEYHVVRQGIDDLALRELLASRFQDVEIDRYFSTQSPMFQAIGSKYLPDNTFGIKGRGRKPSGGAESPGS